MNLTGRTAARRVSFGLWGSVGAFTLVELLVVIAVVAVLAALLLPALGRGKQRAQGYQCLNNHRQLVLAWRMYVDDNRDELPFASEDPRRPETAAWAWVTGYLDFNPNNPTNWNPALSIERSPLWPYCGGQRTIWKCPADQSFVVVNGEPRPRVRSMSMNVYLGGWGGTDGGWGALISDYRIYRKGSDLHNPGPARLFVFLDMREDSIDMGNFATRMAGWPDRPELYGFYDLPGFYHHRACGFSFADGHSEMRRWRDDRTMPPLVPGGLVNDSFASPHNPDVAWLQERSTRPLSDVR
jgi:prepilin-type N-terminal cleavage/methylation domain-containing protein